MKKPLLLIIIFLFFFTVKNNAQNRFMTGSSASNLTNQETKTKGPHGRNNSGINSARETVLPGANQQPTKITGGAISPLVYSGYYREDFEGTFPPANWQVIDVLDPAYAWAQSPIFPYTGANSALIHYSNTGVNAEDWLIMPQFTVAPADSLSFWMGIIDPLFPPDVTQILVSTTDSALSSFTNVIDVLSEGVNYPPTDIAYVYYSYSLAAFAGQNIYVAFQNTNTFGDGVYLDRIAIGTKPPDAASKSIDIPKFAALGTFSPQATFLNDGDSIISFPVTMTSTNGYTSTKNITNLNAGATMQVTFDPWTVLTPGTIGVSIQTNLIGDTFLADDTLSTSIIIMETFTNYGWSSKTLLPVANYLGASAANNNNTASDLFLFGGYSNNLISSLADGFMPVSNMWAPANTVHAMIKGVITASAAVVKNKIYVAGGYNPNFTPANNNQIYNPQTNTWSPGFNMPSPVGDYAIGVYNDSLIYYMGGYSGSVDRSSVQIFSPSGILWIPGTALPVAADGWRGGIVGNKIVVTGGYRQTTGLAQKTTYIGTIDQANPYIISWTTGPDYPGGTLTRPASGVSLDPNSGLVLFTGGDPTGNGTQALDYTFAFDVNSNQWKVGPPKPTPANNLCNFVPVVDNDSLYMVAIGGASPLGSLGTNEWLNMGPFTLVIGVDENNTANINLTSYPSPFSDLANIEFSLDKAAKVKATIVDVLGNEILVLTDEQMQEGNQKLVWDASNSANGVYFCRIFVDGKSASQKLIKY